MPDACPSARASWQCHQLAKLAVSMARAPASEESTPWNRMLRSVTLAAGRGQGTPQQLGSSTGTRQCWLEVACMGCCMATAATAVGTTARSGAGPHARPACMPSTACAPPPEMRKMFSTRPRASMKQAPAMKTMQAVGIGTGKLAGVGCALHAAAPLHSCMPRLPTSLAVPTPFCPPPCARPIRTAARVDGCTAANDGELPGDGGWPLLHPRPV